MTVLAFFRSADARQAPAPKKMQPGAAPSQQRHGAFTPPSHDVPKVRGVNAPVQLDAPKMRATDLTVAYGHKIAVKDVSLEVHEREVLALIGPRP